MSLFERLSNRFWRWWANRENEGYLIRSFKYPYFPPAEAHLKEVLDRRLGHNDKPCILMLKGNHGEYSGAYVLSPWRLKSLLENEEIEASGAGSQNLDQEKIMRLYERMRRNES